MELKDVIVIISDTDFDPLSDLQWQDIWMGYRHRRGWSSVGWDQFNDADETLIRDITVNLHKTGRLHQPRKFVDFNYAATHDVNRPLFTTKTTWLDVLPEIGRHAHPSVQQAYGHLQTVIGLTDD